MVGRESQKLKSGPTNRNKKRLDYQNQGNPAEFILCAFS